MNTIVKEEILPGCAQTDAEAAAPESEDDQVPEMDCSAECGPEGWN